MSSVLVIQKKDEIYIGSDSAVSCTFQNQNYRVSSDGQKLFHISNSIIFCSGNLNLSYNIIKKFQDIKNSNQRNPNVLAYIAKDLYNKFINIQNIKINSIEKNQDNLYLDILVATFENNESVLYQISPYNDFNIVRKTMDNHGDIGIWTGGIETQKCFDLAYYNMLKNPNGLQYVYQATFDMISSEVIGGFLDTYIIDKNGIGKIIDKYKIREKKNLKYIDKSLHVLNTDNFYKVVANHLYGKTIASATLTIENTAGNFLVDQNGMMATDMSLQLTTSNEKNRIFLDPTYGFAVQKKVSGNWVDRFYVDGSGNLNINNGYLAINRDNGLNRILLDPEDGFAIQEKVSGEWKNRFHVNIYGKLLMNESYITVSNDNNSVSINPEYGIDVSKGEISKLFIDSENDNQLTFKDSCISIENGYNKILLDPDIGIRILKTDGMGDWLVDPVFYVDTDGNANFEGIISASEIIGSKFRGDTETSGYIVIGAPSANAGDLTLMRGGTGGKFFRIYDELPGVSLQTTDSASPGQFKTFLYSYNGNTNPYDTWNCTNAYFTNLKNGSSVNYAITTDISTAIAQHVTDYH